MEKDNFSSSLESKVTDWVMGYLPTWKDYLGIDLEESGNNAGIRFLDYGCATGEPAKYLKGLGLEEVVGIDINSSRIDQARIDPGGVVFEMIENHINYNDEYFDGAMANFVFSIIDGKEAQQRALAEIYRVLKPDSPFVMLNNNPRATGIKFTSFQSGEQGKNYEIGQSIPFWAIRSGGTYEGSEILWSQEHYEQLMEDTGFKNIRTFSEKLSEQHLRIMQKLEVDPTIFNNEMKISPYIYVVGYK